MILVVCVNLSYNFENWNVWFGEYKRIVFEGYEEIIKIENILISLLGYILLLKMECVVVFY